MTIADDLVAAMEPWITDDLETYLRAVGSMFAEGESVLTFDPLRFEELGLDPEDYDLDVGYGLLLDPDLTAAIALPYLAQYVGERPDAGLDEDQQREWIVDRPNSRRGTMLSIANAAQRHLIGTRSVTIFERSDGTAGDKPDDVVVIVYAEETPDPAAVQRALRDTFPLELTLHFSVNDLATWQQITVNYANWNAVKADNASWGELLSSRTGGIHFGK